VCVCVCVCVQVCVPTHVEVCVGNCVPDFHIVCVCEVVLSIPDRQYRVLYRDHPEHDRVHQIGHHLTNVCPLCVSSSSNKRASIMCVIIT